MRKTVVTCDRCNKNTNETSTYTLHLQGGILNLLNADLCPDCAVSLQEWMKTLQNDTT